MTNLQADFSREYRRAVTYLEPFITEDICREIGKLNVAYGPPFDFGNYLRRSEVRYERLIRSAKPGRWLEVGALWPALPIALARCGFEVTVAEEYSYYPAEIGALYERVQNEFAIEFVDANATSELIGYDAQFNYASALGVLEHLPYTPRILLENVRKALVPGGSLYIDVPNIYYIHNIVRFLRGNNVMPPMESLYDSGIPFVGHHREYSTRDLRYVVDRAGFDLAELALFNYSSEHHPLNNLSITHHLQKIKALRETIFCQAVKPTS